MRHSERGCFNSCPFKYYLEKIKGLRRVAYSPLAEDRTFGIALHEALDAHYRGKPLEECEAIFTAKYPADKEYKSMAKSHDSGIFTLRNYVEHWAKQDGLWEVIGTEVHDVMEFNDDEHGLHIDLLAKNKQTGEIWAWDHKTTEKQLGKGFWKKYELDAQVSRYTKYIKDKYGSCGGFIVNGIQVGHRQRAYKGEPAGYYQKFDRQPFSRSEAQLRFWEESEREWEALIDVCKEASSWPKHLGSLCGWCDFYELCMSADDEAVRDTLYTDEPTDDAMSLQFKVIDES